MDLELALLDQRDGVDEAIELAQDVRAHHDAHAVVGDLAQDVAELPARERIEAVGGLVEQQQLGLVDHRARDREALAHALAHLADQRVGLARQVERARADGVTRLLRGGVVLPVALGEEAQVARPPVMLG